MINYSREARRRNLINNTAKPLPEPLLAQEYESQLMDTILKEEPVNVCPSAPRSYMVASPSGTICRNKRQLNVNPDSTETSLTKQSTKASSAESSTKQSVTTSTHQPIVTHSRTGTSIIPPQGFLTDSKGRCSVTC